MSTKPNTSQITYDTGTNKQDLNNILDTVVPITDYTALRAYTGRATTVRITTPGIDGFFTCDLTDTTSADNGGTIIIAGTKRWKRVRERISVKDFLCDDGLTVQGNGTHDDTTGIQKAIDYAFSRGGGTVFFPHGNYRTSATLVVKQNVTLQGESRFGTQLIGLTQTIQGLLLNSPAAAVHSLTIRGFDVGIKMGSSPGSTDSTAYYGDVHFCHITENRIGIDSFHAYMTSIHGCKIVFNGYGLIIRGQSYVMNVYDNEIGNCLRGVGVYISESAGCVIRDNGIEGCRNITNNIGGLGLIILSSQRTLIEGNWFESNFGTADHVSGADVMIGNPNDTISNTIITNCVPTEYVAEATAGSSGIYGPIHFRGNFHYATKHGYLINSQMYNGAVTIEAPTFVGTKGRFNKAIRILGTAAACNIALHRLFVLNTGDSTIDAEMNTGIKASCVFVEGTIPSHGKITLDGVDLFTATLTQKQFLALSTATLNVSARPPSSGAATLKNNVVRASGGTSGFSTTEGTGRALFQSAPIFGIGDSRTVALLCRRTPGTSTDPGLIYSTTTGGFAGASAIDADGVFRIISIANINSVEAQALTGEYFGLLNMPTLDFQQTAIRGCVRLVITDLDVVAYDQISSTSPAGFSSATSYNWVRGDRVYSNLPSAGGYAGWVCTSSGAPGTWKGFGVIEA